MSERAIPKEEIEALRAIIGYVVSECEDMGCDSECDRHPKIVKARSLLDRLSPDSAVSAPLEKKENEE